MEGVLFVTALLTYVGTYILSLHFASALLGRGADAMAPRLIALIALALSTLAFAVWAQVTLVDSTLLTAPDLVAHGRYGERVRLLSIVPAAAVAVGALLFGWRSRRVHAKARTLRERPAA